MELGLHPGIIFALAIGLFLGFHLLLRWPLPLTFITVAVATALLGDFGIPFRHLVEGGFGFINLVLALFAGAFFGHMMRRERRRRGGRRPALCGWPADGCCRCSRSPGCRCSWSACSSASPAWRCSSAGVFAVPALRRIGFDDATIAAFIAVMATAGMIAPPMNVPALLIADGVNMPWTNVAKPLLALALPLAAAALAWFAWCGPAKPPEAPELSESGFAACLRGFAPLVLMVVIWVAVRIFDTVFIDPASPLILVIGGLSALPMLKRGTLRGVIMDAFTGTPLQLAAVLVSVGVLVQVMTLTGVRGWLVISAMSLESPWNYPSLLVGIPLLGGALTAMAASDVLGVPAAFSFIGQDMILNVAALSAIASLAEFVPPTSISAALACYVVGGGTVGQVFRRAWPPMAVLAALALLMLIFARQLAGVLT